MPGCSRLSIDNIVQTCKQANSLGIGGVALFPNLSDDIKDSLASERLEIEFYPLLHLFTFFLLIALILMVYYNVVLKKLKEKFLS